MPQNNGKRFENNFQKSCERQGLLIERYKDSNKFGYSDQTRFAPENPCDFHIFDGNTLYYVELKSTTSSSMSFNQPPDVQEKGRTKPMIKAHQIKALLERSAYDNVVCGLIVDYADRQTKTEFIPGGTYFIEINTWYEWAKSCENKSMNLQDTQRIGVNIEREKLKTNYRYNIKKLLEEIEKG